MIATVWHLNVCINAVPKVRSTVGETALVGYHVYLHLGKHLSDAFWKGEREGFHFQS